MSITIRGGQSIDLNVQAGESLKVSTITGTYTATVLAGAGAGTALATESSGGGTYGPYAAGVTIRIKSSPDGLCDIDVGVSPALTFYPNASFGMNSSGDIASLVDGAGIPFAGIPIAYTLATLPSAVSNSGAVAYVSDVGAGIYVRSNGTRWLPINGRAVLYEVPATEPTSNTAAETTVVSVPLPIGLMANGDSLQVTARVSKSGSSDSHTFIARISAGALTPLGTSTGWSAGQPATTNRFGMFMFNIKRVSATSVKPGASGAGYSATSTTAPAAITVPNMDTQQTYLQLTSTITGGGGETVTWENARVEWVAATA